MIKKVIPSVSRQNKDTYDKINPWRVYTLKEIQIGEFIPWARNDQTIRKIIEADKIQENILKAIVVGSMTRRRYGIQGKNIKNYLKKYGPALMATIRKTQHDRSKKIKGRS